jgi:predicted DNA-binding ribbon-helix-helix protein
VTSRRRDARARSSRNPGRHHLGTVGEIISESVGGIKSERWAASSRNGGRLRPESAMKSLVKKRSIVIDGHKSSVSLEDEFWSSLQQMAASRSVTLSKIVGDIDTGRGEIGNLSSAIRLFVLAYYRERAVAPAKT